MAGSSMSTSTELSSPLLRLPETPRRRITPPPSRYRKSLTTFRGFFSNRHHRPSKPKNVIIKNSWASQWPLMLHLITISTCSVIVAINYKGAFVGYKFATTHLDETQKLATLALQVCAKAIELIIVASLGLIILDFLHHLLIFDEDGLPLGLSGSKLAFSNLLYVASPSFCAGIATFKSKRTKWFAVILIVSCALLATFVGPSSALLLLPDVVNDWHAGHAKYFIQDDNFALWPSELSEFSVDLEGCSVENVTVNASNSDAFNHCPWTSAFSLALITKQIRLEDNIAPSARNITVHDVQNQRRAILYNDMNRATGLWSVSGMSHINLMSLALYVAWIEAVSWASSLTDMTHRARWYFLRYRDLNDIQVLSKLPGSWAKCYVQEDIFFNSSAAIDFPPQPNYGYDDAQDGTYFQLTPDFVQNITKPTSFWIPRPAYLVNATHDGRDPSNYFPSAALLIQIPDATSANQGKVISCSIEARWIAGTNRFREFHNDFAGYALHYPEVVMGEMMNSFRPTDDGTWEVVDLDLSWLNILSLMSPNSSGSDPISTFITLNPQTLNFDLDASMIYADYVSNSWDVYRLQAFLSTLVTDGMARVNSLSTANYYWYNIDAYPTEDDAIKKVYTPLLLTTFEVPNVTDQVSTPNAIELTWDIYIAGYVYRADSLAYYLSSTVLIVSALFAFAHMVYRLLWVQWKQNYIVSSAWAGSYEMLTLALESPEARVKPSNVGIFSQYESRQSLLKLRITDTEATAGKEGEKPHVLVGNYQYSHLNPREPLSYTKVEAGRDYS